MWTPFSLEATAGRMGSPGWQLEPLRVGNPSASTIEPGLEALLRSLRELRRAPAFVNSSACQPKPWRRLVEAAGVEPASEMARPDKTTCVSGSVSQSRPQHRQPDAEPSLIGFKPAASGGGFGPIPQDYARPKVRGLASGSGYLIVRQRKQTADYWQLLFSSRFTGAWNPARLIKTTPSRRDRYAPLITGYTRMQNRAFRKRLRSTPLPPPQRLNSRPTGSCSRPIGRSHRRPRR